MWPDPEMTLRRPQLAVAASAENLKVPSNSNVAIPTVVLSAIPSAGVCSDPVNRLSGDPAVRRPLVVMIS